uniref:Protein YIPF n=1 Tax=Chrysotila carterae TaxID=13221 RepID=A0A7S4EV80_CHRCT|mmetsp:Transcript_31302/g.68475  ORF Transcript_31302/g.68475 Transcript_31302/m.68475 type:complete len:303 (+) Transcript_31302:83-991(+)
MRREEDAPLLGQGFEHMGGRMGGYPEGPTGIYMGGQVSNLTNGQIGGPMSSYMNSGAPNGWQQAGTEQNWQRVHGQGQGGSQFSAQMGENPQTNGQMFTGPMNAPNAQTPNGRSGILPRNISATLLGEGEADEPPILEELGINFEHIYRKTLSVLWPQRSKLDQEVINDSDFAGPMIFCLVLGVLLLFKGKVHFGYIYGVFTTGLLGLWAVFNLMSSKGIDVYRTASVMGYCLLPIVILAALSIPFDVRGAAGLVLIPLAVLWCSNAAALFFVVALEADDRRWLLAYPVMLFYTCFALITIF